jgi:hypothetical protein
MTSRCGPHASSLFQVGPSPVSLPGRNPPDNHCHASLPPLALLYCAAHPEPSPPRAPGGIEPAAVAHPAHPPSFLTALRRAPAPLPISSLLRRVEPPSIFPTPPSSPMWEPPIAECRRLLNIRGDVLSTPECRSSPEEAKGAPSRHCSVSTALWRFFSKSTDASHP